MSEFIGHSSTGHSNLDVSALADGPLQQLQSPFLEEANIRLFVKRDDLIHPLFGGNKWRKLKYNLIFAKENQYETLLTFGGAWSNHIYATAAAAKHFGFNSIGIIRGEKHTPLNATLTFAEACGMQLHYVSRAEYRQKHETQYQQKLKQQFGNVYILPEGGSNALAMKGCEEIIDEIDVYTQPIVDYFKLAPSELFLNYRKKVGHSGHLDCTFGMMEQIHEKFPDFMNAGLETYLKDTKSQSNEKAKIIVPEIQLKIANDIISTLKIEFGENEKGWWSQGVPKTIRIKVAQRREDDPDRPALEESFDLINYKQVILDNWPLFGEKYSRGKGKKNDKMSWMEELNVIRRKVAHPERGRVTIDELGFLNEITRWLDK